MVPGDSAMLVPSESPSAADEERVLCIIRDMTNTVTQTKFSLNLPASLTGRQFMEDVAKNLGYEARSFLLTYERPTDGGYDEVILNDLPSTTLAEICFNCGNKKRNNFTVMEKDGPPVKLIVEESDMPTTSLDHASSHSAGDTAYGTGDNTYSRSMYGPHLPSSPSATAYTISLQSDTGFVGLVNQAMTCYLSSLLQTLYMTPEFRNAVYGWKFEGVEEDAVKSIPYQLQKLFLELQTSKKRAIETTDITRSFGWDSSEAWQQHDVQELCRVMFDALEKTWSKTSQSNLINHLYQGRLKDYVKCLECGQESARTDTFLDIPLVIKPFGSTVAYGSVEQAMNGFVEPETLNGNNQYHCDKCGKKCDAHKGLKFLSFPYLLTLQLKRFDFDYVSLHRIKLNDRMTFPDFLKLNHLIEGNSEDCTDTQMDEHTGGGDSSPGAANPPPAQDTAAADEEVDIGCSASGTSITDIEAETNHRNLQHSTSKGGYEYELFSIMIHSGSAAGGHYYAYIKSFDNNEWYSFNDQNVSAITHEDIRKTYGGAPMSRGYYSSLYASSTNAYMLMYRQINPEKNTKFYKEDEFPQHLKDEMIRSKTRAEAEKLQHELDKNLCKIRVFCFHPVHSKLLESRLVIHQDKTLTEATEVTRQLFELDGVVPIDCCRLIKYDESLDYIDQSYDRREDEPMGSLLGGVKMFYPFELLLELKQPGMIFQEYRPGGVTVKVHVVELENETIGPPITVRAYLTQTLQELKELITQLIPVPLDTMRCVRERYYNDLKLLVTPTRTLKTEGFIKSNKVFIECSGLEDDNQVLFPETKFYRILDRYENTIRLHIVLPPYVPSNHNSGCPSQVTSVNQTTEGEMSHDDDMEGCSPLLSDVCINDSQSHTSNNSTVHSHIGKHDEQTAADKTHRTSSDTRTPPDGEATCEQNPIQTQSSVTMSQSGNTQDNKTVSLNTSTTGPVECSESPGLGEASGSGHEETWDLDDTDRTDWAGGGGELDDEYRRYFTAQLHINTENSERSLTVYVDKRIHLGSLKKELEKFVGAPNDAFKVYRVYSNSQEVEVSRLTETLATYSDDSKLVVKMGRALRKGEYRVKIYQLLLNEEDVSKLLVEVIFSRGMSVLQSKRIIIDELKIHCDMDVEVDRFRLRKKSWKNPTKIYRDEQIYDKDITILSHWEVFAEILQGPEPLTESCMMSVYVRRWRPSQYVVDDMQEIILSEPTIDELYSRIAHISGIDRQQLEIAKAKGTFPCEVPLLDVHNELDWGTPITAINMYPLSISEDGAVLYYMDKEETLMELSDSKRKELQQKQNSRSVSYSLKFNYSPRKEKALKIYTGDTKSDSDNKSTSASQKINISL